MLKDYYGKDKYRTESRPAPRAKDVKQAIDLIQRAERPLLIAGQGVFQDKAWEPLLKAAEKNEIAVVTSGPSRGHFPDDHRLSAALTPDAAMSADLVIFVGQYCMPSPGEYRFNPDVKTIRVHPVQEDLGRNWPLDLGLSAAKSRFSRPWPTWCRPANAIRGSTSWPASGSDTTRCSTTSTSRG